MKRLRLSVLGSVVALTAAALAGAAGGAAGPTGHIAGVVPPMGVRPAAGSNLTYHGGPVTEERPAVSPPRIPPSSPQVTPRWFRSLARDAQGQ